MSKIIKYAAGIVLGHALVATVHGMAHQRLGVDLSFAHKLFVLVVITLAPLVALILQFTPLRRWGAALLLLSMFGSLVFGVVNHFLITSSDHVLHLPEGEWRAAFQISAGVLAATEILGCLIGLWALRSLGSVR